MRWDNVDGLAFSCACSSANHRRFRQRSVRKRKWEVTGRATDRSKKLMLSPIDPAHKSARDTGLATGSLPE